MTTDNYTPVTVRITSIRMHSNADRLRVTNIFGNNIIVGLETKVGDLGIYFPLESQIDETFAKNNDLIRRKDPVTGKPAGGMFDENRRVRCQKFRGEKSEGFWIPIDSLKGLFDDEPGEGILLPQLATKYVPKTRDLSMAGPKQGRQPRESKIIENQFRFHADTAQLGRNIHKLNPTDTVVITWKLHGTSAIVSNCLVKKPIPKLFSFLWPENFMKKYFGVSIEDKHYEYVYASRRVIKNEFAESKQHYYGEDLWSKIGKREFEGKLKTGETIYYEIVGYTEAGSFIQKGFDYSCVPKVFLDEKGLLHGPQNNVFVYRITQTAPDGSVVELQWNQLKERCKQLGVPHVPEIFYGEADITYVPREIEVPGGPIGESIEEWRDKYLAYLKERFVHDQDSIFCNNKVPEEGICVRKEGLEIETFKLKSFRFLEFESKALDAGEVDTETEQTL